MEGENMELLIGEIAMSYKSHIPVSSMPVITSSHSMYQVLLQTWDNTRIELQEQFKVLLLNRANRVVGLCTLTSGNAVSTIVDPKQVFVPALLANADQVVIAHNHPSGSTKPSWADETLTRKIRDAGNLLDIRLLDHIIVTKEGYYSFSDGGLL